MPLAALVELVVSSSPVVGQSCEDSLTGRDVTLDHELAVDHELEGATITAGGAGDFVVGPGVGSLAESLGAGSLSAGQAFYRDPTGPCSRSLDLTNAFEMTLRP